MPKIPVEPRVMASQLSKITKKITSTPIVAIAIAPSCMRVRGRPTSAATNAPTTVAMSTAGTKPTCACAITDGRSGSVKALIAGGIVISAAVYAPTPMNATCPNVTMPELPEKDWIESTNTSATKKFTTVRRSAGLATALAISAMIASGTASKAVPRTLRSSQAGIIAHLRG